MTQINQFKWQETLILLIAGSISVFAFAPCNISLVMLISILILLWVIQNKPHDTKFKVILLYAYIYGFTYFNAQLYWIFYSLDVVIHAGFVVSLIGHICFMLFLASYIVLAIVSYFKLQTKSRSFNLIFLFPSIWVMFEWLRGWILGGFSWCDVSYSQINPGVFKGLFPILGSYGVSWIFLSLSGALFLLISNKPIFNINKKYLRWVLIYFSVIGITLFYINSIEYTHPYGKMVNVELIQGNIPEGEKWNSTNALNVYKEEIAKAHADIVLIPETAIALFEDELPHGYLDGLIDIAKSRGFDLIVGMPVVIDDKGSYVNAAIALTAKGQPYYAKYHLVPYGEYIPAKWILGPVYKAISLPMVGFSEGSENQKPIVLDNQKMAFNICYENGFNFELYKAASNSTMMVNLSDMVWYGTTIAKDEHLQLSQARAMENQRYFIQETNTGLTAIIDQNGHIQSILPIFKRDTLNDYVQGRIGYTPFEKLGNLTIIIFCSSIIAFAVYLSFIRRKRKK